MKNCLFYGSLRIGHYNHDRFKLHHGDDCMEHEETITIPGYQLYDTGHGYPAANKTENEDHILVVDKMKVNEAAFDHINDMELNAGYTREGVKINGEIYTIYVQEPRGHYKLVESGDWSNKK